MLYFSREQWGASYGTGFPLKRGPVALVVMHHTYKPDVSPEATIEQESLIVRERMESFHVRTLFDETPMARRHIGYNWVVMPSGRIYEGVGWGRVGAHAPGVNSKSVGICVAMNSNLHPPTDKAVRGVREVIAEGVIRGHISASYRIAPHSEFRNTECPGSHLRAMLAQLRPGAGQVVKIPPTLEYGDTGADVAMLQRLLRVQGPDRFGPKTLKAVLAFQQANGLHADGKVGPKTWGKLLANRRT